MKEFAFDVRLLAVVRVVAETEGDARDAMDAVLDSCNPSQPFLDGFNQRAARVKVAEFSLSNDAPSLFEIDGVDLEDRISELREGLFTQHQDEGGCDSEFEAWLAGNGSDEAKELKALEAMTASRDREES